MSLSLYLQVTVPPRRICPTERDTATPSHSSKQTTARFDLGGIMIYHYNFAVEPALLGMMLADLTALPSESRPG